MKITKEMFLRYEKVRLSGKYNMMTEWQLTRKKAHLTKDEYFEILTQYSHYKKLYMD